jgi:hypothetical protein
VSKIYIMALYYIMFIDFENFKTVNGRTIRKKTHVYENISQQQYPNVDDTQQHSTYNPVLQSEIQNVQLDKDIENFENLVFYTTNGKIHSSYMNNDKKNDDDKEDEKNDDDKEDEEIQLNVNYTTHMYMGAVTVVGLFVFYRMLQKTK